METFTPIIVVHALAALFVLLLGPFQILRRRRDRAHRVLGVAWVSAMVVVCASSFGIHDGRFSWLHALATWTLLCMVFAIAGIRRRNVPVHRGFMIGSYIGTLAAFAFGIPLGMAAGTLVGGLLAATYGWRTAFIVVGLLGLLVAPLLRLTVKDPKRGGTDAVKTEAQVAALAAAPVGTDRVGRIAAQVMLGIGAGLLILAGGSWLFGMSLGNPLVLGFGGLLAGVIGASLMVARLTASVVIRKPSFWLLALGAASSSVCGYGVAGWLPLFFMRSFDLTLRQTSWYYSGIALIGGILGIWLGGMIADKLSKKGKGAYPLTPAVAFLISGPCFILAMNSPWLIGLVLPGGGTHAQQLILAFLIFLLPTGLNLAWLGPITAAVQHLVPAAMRSTASALFLLINNLLGIAVGFYYFGWMSDLLAPRFGEESLRWAIYTGMGFYALAALLLFGAARTLKRDWVD